MKRSTSLILWFTAFIITIFVAISQRITGPTYPVKGRQTVDHLAVTYKLLRSHIQYQPLPVSITISPAAADSFKAYLLYRLFPSNDHWTRIEMKNEKNERLASIPGQPAAGKVQYRIILALNGKDIDLIPGQGVIARFKGQVPTAFLITHVVFMFLGLLLGIRSGFDAFRKNGNTHCLVNWTVLIIMIGGLILGPIVQKYAFGNFWTGFPLGFDLTDNKTLLVVIFWLATLFLKKRSRWWVLAACVLMISIYLIPHSLFGSELDYQTGKLRN